MSDYFGGDYFGSGDAAAPTSAPAYTDITSPDELLGITRDDLRSEIGRYMGFGRSYASFHGGASSQEDVDRVIQRGLRQFYYPTYMDRQRPKTHLWSFLLIHEEFTTVADTAYYSLPLNFTAVEGPLEYDTAESTHIRMQPVEIINHAEMLRHQRNPVWDSWDYPKWAAVIPEDVRGDTTDYPRKTLRLFPVPTTTYTLRYRYRAAGVDPSLLGDPTDTDDRYLIGSAEHAETIIASCLAIAESMQESNANDKKRAFDERLLASVMFDKSAVTAESVGNMNGSRDTDRFDPRLRVTLATHNGRYTT